MSSIRKWTPPASKEAKPASPQAAEANGEDHTSKAVAAALFKRIGVLLSHGDFVKAATLCGMLRIQLLAMAPDAEQADKRANEKPAREVS